jgi:transcription antitermination factor NusG
MSWYCVHVRAKLTRDIADSLGEKGYESFTPVSPVSRRWCDRIGRIEVPLFPGYVFSRLDLRNRMPILTTPGVYGLVGVGKSPAPIEEHEIANLRGLLHSGLPIEPWAFLRRGDHVVIDHGPLAGVSGILVGVKNRYRLVVSVELIARSIAVEVDADSVRAFQAKTA